MRERAASLTHNPVTPPPGEARAAVWSRPGAIRPARRSIEGRHTLGLSVGE